MRSDLIVAFDLLEAGWKEWEFVLIGFVFLFIGLVGHFGPRLFPQVSKGVGQLVDPDGSQHRSFGWMPKCFIGFSSLWILGAFGMTYGGYRDLVEDYQTGNFEIAEGFVNNFVPMPKGGKPYESFTVDGVSFTYSDYNIVPGFNNTRSHGGPIEEGIFVRVYYIGNSIIRLEVEPAAMVGKERNRSVSLWEMPENKEPIDHPAAPYMAFYLYVIQSYLVIAIATRLISGVRQERERSPELYAVAKNVFYQFLCLGLLPVFAGITSYLAINGAIIEGSHKVSDGILYLLSSIALFYLNYWIYFRGGAEWVAGLPNAEVKAWVVKVHSTLPLLLLIGPAIEFLSGA